MCWTCANVCPRFGCWKLSKILSSSSLSLRKKEKDSWTWFSTEIKVFWEGGTGQLLWRGGEPGSGDSGTKKPTSSPCRALETTPRAVYKKRPRLTDQINRKTRNKWFVSSFGYGGGGPNTTKLSCPCRYLVSIERAITDYFLLLQRRKNREKVLCGAEKGRCEKSTYFVQERKGKEKEGREKRVDWSPSFSLTGTHTRPHSVNQTTPQTETHSRA